MVSSRYSDLYSDAAQLLDTLCKTESGVIEHRSEGGAGELVVEVEASKTDRTLHDTHVVGRSKLVVVAFAHTD